MAKFKPLPPLAELRARFDYDPETGLFTHQGKPRGYLYKSGYVMLRWGRARQLRANRVAWYLHTGKDPAEHIVEHKNGNRSDNSFRNLRLATNQENAFNRRMQSGAISKATNLERASELTIDSLVSVTS